MIFNDSYWSSAILKWVLIIHSDCQWFWNDFQGCLLILEWFLLILGDFSLILIIFCDSQMIIIDTEANLDYSWTIPTDFYWSLMILMIFKQLLLVHSNLQWFSMIFTNSLQFSMILGHCLMIFKKNFAVSNDSQWFLLIIGNSCWFSLFSNDS